MPKLTELASKATPTASDEVVITDVADSNNTKRSTLSSLASTIGQLIQQLGNAASTLTLFTGGSERVRIDSSGNVGIGTSSPVRPLHINGGGSDGILKLTRDSNGNAVTDGFELRSSSLQATLLNFENTPLTLHTNGAERARIDSSGNFLVGKAAASLSAPGFEASSGTGPTRMTRLNAASVEINREGDDGTLVSFYQDSTTEGNISVSGTTVSYNGGHLARWSRLADNSKPDSILKGTVMSNLDAMIVWHHEAEGATYYGEGDELPEGVSVGDVKTEAKEAFDEDNEQLNHTEISAVEGDPNVAGVFVAWDNEDEYNDFNLAMTGDMVIRIAQGETVARGDLLMSAGDGTAKPQGDDIVRSKTIAKVISTEVDTTYPDGSYTVPCVLMAC